MHLKENPNRRTTRNHWLYLSTTVYNVSVLYMQLAAQPVAQLSRRAVQLVAQLAVELPAHVAAAQI
jgi:hypothetical protein